MWQCESPGEMTWYEAQEYAKSLSSDGKEDWRLPTLAEFESLWARPGRFPRGDVLCRRRVSFEMGYLHEGGQ